MTEGTGSVTRSDI